MLQLKAELNAISRNFDQVVRRLRTHRHLPGLKQWIQLNEQDKTQLEKQIEAISTNIEKIYALWSHD